MGAAQGLIRLPLRSEISLAENVAYLDSVTPICVQLPRVKVGTRRLAFEGRKGWQPCSVMGAMIG